MMLQAQTTEQQKRSQLKLLIAAAKQCNTVGLGDLLDISFQADTDHFFVAAILTEAILSANTDTKQTFVIAVLSHFIALGFDITKEQPTQLKVVEQEFDTEQYGFTNNDLGKNLLFLALSRGQWDIAKILYRVNHPYLSEQELMQLLFPADPAADSVALIELVLFYQPLPKSVEDRIVFELTQPHSLYINPSQQQFSANNYIRVITAMLRFATHYAQGGVFGSNKKRLLEFYQRFYGNHGEFYPTDAATEQKLALIATSSKASSAAATTVTQTDIVEQKENLQTLHTQFYGYLTAGKEKSLFDTHRALRDEECQFSRAAIGHLLSHASYQGTTSEQTVARVLAQNKAWVVLQVAALLHQYHATDLSPTTVDAINQAVRQQKIQGTVLEETQQNDVLNIKATTMSETPEFFLRLQRAPKSRVKEKAVATANAGSELKEHDGDCNNGGSTPAASSQKFGSQLSASFSKMLQQAKAPRPATTAQLLDKYLAYGTKKPLFNLPVCKPATPSGKGSGTTVTTNDGASKDKDFSPDIR